MNAKNAKQNTRPWDFSQSYETVPKDGTFMKRTLSQVEKDPLLGEKDRWQLSTELRRMDKGISYTNGLAPQEHVQKVHAAISAKRKQTEDEALGQDPFIRQTILDNPQLPQSAKTPLARQANKARQSQEYLTLGEKIDNEILKKVSRTSLGQSQTGQSEGGKPKARGLLSWQNPETPGPRNREIIGAGNRIARDGTQGRDSEQTQEANATGTENRDQRGWFAGQEGGRIGARHGHGAEHPRLLRDSQLEGSGNQRATQGIGSNTQSVVPDAELRRHMEQQGFQNSQAGTPDNDLEAFISTASEEQLQAFARESYLQQLPELTGEGSDGANAWWNGHPSDDDQDTIRIIVCEGSGNAGSSQGHIAVMRGGRVYSYQGSVGFTEYNSLVEYLMEKDNNWYRDVKILTINTTPDQADAMEKYWRGYNIPYGAGGSCATPVELSMRILGLESGSFLRDSASIRVPAAFFIELYKSDLIQDIIQVKAPLRTENNIDANTWDWPE